MKPQTHRFNFIGKPSKISKEEVRAIFYACDSLLSYHKAEEQNRQITVRFKKNPKNNGKKVGGTYLCNYIVVNKDYDYGALLTVALHEMIHHYFFDDENREKVTSTLTAKLRKDVSRIANVLAENTYKRAAYIAHTKIAYRPKGEDHYDNNQYHSSFNDSTATKYR